MAGITVSLAPSLKTRPIEQPQAFYKYFNGNDKSVIGSWNYTVEFTNQSIFNPLFFKSFNILDVNIPVYKFTRNTIAYGSIPKSYSTFNTEDGREFSVTFEEDRLGTITAIVNVLQKTIMKSSGVYNTLPNQNLGDCIVRVYALDNSEIMYWTMKNIYFIGSDDVSLAYSSSDSLKVKVSFGCDVIEFYSDAFDQV